MVGFVLSGLCTFRLLFMGLKHLCWLLTAHASFGLLSIGLSGLVVSLSLVLVLSSACWVGPLGVILLSAWFGLGFVCFLGCLALWLTEVRRVYRLLEMVGEGSPVHGPIHLLFASAAEDGFRIDPVDMGWSRPGLPLLSNLAGPIQHFRAAILDAWRNKVAAGLCGREGFRGGPLLDVHGLLAAP